jgi:4-aminobutyrate aminotransferase-like enzyme
VNVHELPAPSSARVTGQPDPTTGDDWLPEATDKLARSAAVILDYSQGGVYHNARYQDRVAELARNTGTIWIADETVTGFGRVGGWYQFEAGSSRPDMVTMGKSLAGGSAPAGAVVMSRDLVDQLSGSSWQTYSTFRGHPIAVAAITAHLRIVSRDRLHERATELDSVMFDGLCRLADLHPGIARIDGRGLHWTIELHGPDWRTWRGEEAEPLASRVVTKALDAGVLISTSAEQTSLFLAPPLIIEREQLELLFEALDDALKVADEEHEREGAA